MNHPSAPGSRPVFERSLAVVVGVNSYSQGVPLLHNAVRDAAAVADTLEQQGFEVIRLLDSQASLQALTELFFHHLPSLQPSLDRLLIYFAGHGLAHTDEQNQLSGFLLPADACRDVPASYWPMASLREALRQLSCRHLLLILDCCFAGAFPHAAVRDLRPPASPTPLYLERFRHFTSHRSFQLLLSTAHDELASDRLLSKPHQETLGDGQHSPFALALLQALQLRSPADFNQDGLLTASELYTFLRDRLLSLLPSHQQQTPSLWNLDWHDGGEFLFCLEGALPELPSAAPLSKDFNPYLGLRPFSATHRHLFFGRERGIDALCEHLQNHPLLLLCGPSGAGKSSLVHAGLLPRLAENSSWKVPASLRPTARPLHALASWLASLAPGEAPPSAAALAVRPTGAIDFLRAFLSRRPELSLLLVIDPLEELVTACLDNPLRGAFLRALCSILQLEHPRLRVVLLLRSDFEPHFLSLLQGASFPLALWHTNRVTVPPMNRDELRRCIEKPAEVRTLFFAPGLVERLLDDVEQMPGALPLLSVALSELFDAHLDSGREDRTLSFADYERLGGGIAGALQRRAELVFSGAPPPLSEGQGAPPPLAASELPAFQQTLRNVLLRMVSLEGGEPARRRVRRAELEYPASEEKARVQRALLTLEASRLIVASDDGGPCVEPAHDALLAAWPRLHDWVRQAQRELLLVRRISHAASEWARQRHATDFLWTDARLDQVGLAPASLRREHTSLALPTSSPESPSTEPLAFNAEESAFLRTSAERRRFVRRRRNTLQFLATASILLLAIVAFRQAGSARQQQRRAEETAAQLQVEQKTVQKEKQRAEHSEQEARNQAGVATERAREASEARDDAQRNQVEAELAQRRAEESARNATQQEAIAQDQARDAKLQKEIAEAQRAIAEEQTIEATRQREKAQANEQLALESGEAARKSAREAQLQKDAANASAERAHQEEQIASANAQVAEQKTLQAERSAIEAGHQQNEAFRNARDAQVQRDAATTEAGRAKAEADRVLYNSKLSQAEHLLSEDPTRAALVLRETISSPTADTQWLQTALAIHQQEVSEAILTAPNSSVTIPPQFSPDGSHVLAISGNALYLWRADGTGQPRVLRGAEKPPYLATFSPDGALVLALASNKVLLWRTDSEEPPRVFAASKKAADLGNVSFSPVGSRLLVAADNTLYLWHTDSSAPPQTLGNTPSPLDFAAFSPDGSLILTQASDGTTQLWNTDDAGSPRTLSSPSAPAYSAQFSPDGQHIIARAGTNLLLWTLPGLSGPQVIPSPVGFVDSVIFSPRGDRVLATSSTNELLVWKITGTDAPAVLSPPSVPMRAARFSPDGQRVLALSGNAAYLWDPTQTAPTKILSGSCDSMKSALFSPDGEHIATLCLNGTAVLWKAEGPEEPQVLSTPTVPVSSLIFSRDGMYVVTTSGNSAQIWRADVSSEPRRLIGHTQNVQHALFSGDGARLLTTAGNSIRVWRTRPRDSVPFPQRVTPGVASAAVSSDGSRLVTTSIDSTVHLWSTQDPRPPIAIAGPSAQVRLAEFTQDGSRIQTTSFDGTRRVWQADGSTLPMPLPADDEPILGGVSQENSSRTQWGSLFLTIRPALGVSIESQGGTTPPLLLEQAGISQAFFLSGGRRIATLSQHELRTWPLASSDVLSSLQHMTTACLSTPERSSFLNETPTNAVQGFSRCEQSQGRPSEAPRSQTPFNPIDDPAFFVNQLYLDLLDRPPSPAERRQLLSPLEYCGINTGCMDTARREAARILFESPEHRSNQNLYEGPPGYSVRYITRGYTGFARRQPDEDDEPFRSSGLDGGNGYADIIQVLLVAPEYRARFGTP